MSEILSRALSMSFDSNKIGLITSMQLSISNNIINITNFESGDWQKKLKAGGDWTMTVGFNYSTETTDNQGALADAAISSGATGPIDLGPETPATGDISFTGDVIIEEFSLDMSEANTQVTGTCSFSGNGALTRAVAV